MSFFPPFGVLFHNYRIIANLHTCSNKRTPCFWVMMGLVLCFPTVVPDRKSDQGSRELGTPPYRVSLVISQVHGVLIGDNTVCRRSPLSCSIRSDKKQANFIQICHDKNVGVVGFGVTYERHSRMWKDTWKEVLKINKVLCKWLHDYLWDKYSTRLFKSWTYDNINLKNIHLNKF